MTHLIISCDELCYRVEDTFSHKFLWPCHCLEVKFLLFLCCEASRFSLFFFLHHSPNSPWNSPMRDRYFPFFHTSPCKWDNADRYVGDMRSSLLYGKPYAFRLTWETFHWSFTIVSNPSFHMLSVWRLTCKRYTTVLLLSGSHLSLIWTSR